MVSKYGEVFTIDIFLYLLGYSRIKYLEVTFDKKRDTLIKCLDKAFEYTKGIPEEILFDNMSTVVDRKETGFKQAAINTEFKQFCKDYGFLPVTCRPYRPQTKGKVEALAKLTDRLDVYNYEFEDVEELKSIVRDVTNDVNNEISQATNEKPVDRLKKEKEYLYPLPSNQVRDSYTTRLKVYNVSKESMITYKGNKYSVPTYYIGKQLKVIESTNVISIYYNTDFVTSYDISKSFLNYKKEHAHEILKSDALRHKSSKEIDDFIENNLKKMDMLIT